MGFFRQEYWSALSFPAPSDLPDLGIKPVSPALQEDSLPDEPLGKSSHFHNYLFWIRLQTRFTCFDDMSLNSLLICNSPAPLSHHSLLEETLLEKTWVSSKIHEEFLMSSVLCYSVSSVRSLQPHGLQNARLPCPSPSPRACSNLCPSSWCHSTICSP